MIGFKDFWTAVWCFMLVCGKVAKKEEGAHKVLNDDKVILLYEYVYMYVYKCEYMILA